MPLLDGIQQQLSGERALSIAGLAREHGHCALCQPADHLVQRRNHGFDARHGSGIIGRNVRLLDDTLDRHGRGAVQRFLQCFRTMEVQNLVGVLAGRSI